MTATRPHLRPTTIATATIQFSTLLDDDDDPPAPDDDDDGGQPNPATVMTTRAPSLNVSTPTPCSSQRLAMMTMAVTLSLRPDFATTTMATASHERIDANAPALGSKRCLSIILFSLMTTSATATHATAPPQPSPSPLQRVTTIAQTASQRRRHSYMTFCIFGIQ